MNSVKPDGASLTGPGELGEAVGRIRQSRYPTTSSHSARRRCDGVGLIRGQAL
ncbi:hypothetical protein AVG49_000040 [Salmonella enterica subsp. salamae]|nr:hypothetical protein [Salmonella enterica subsp. salamae]